MCRDKTVSWGFHRTPIASRRAATQRVARYNLAMRFVLLICGLWCCGHLCAQSDVGDSTSARRDETRSTNKSVLPPPATPKLPRTRPLQMPELQFDLGYRRGRSDTDINLDVLDFHARYLHHFVQSEGLSHALTAHTGLEQWFHVRPTPRRLMVGTGFATIMRDSLFQGGYWANHDDPETNYQFLPPYDRLAFLEFNIAARLDYVRSEGLGPSTSGPGDRAPQDGMRLSASGSAQFLFLGFEIGGAATAQLDHTFPLDAEFWVVALLGRPVSRFSLSIGYYFHSTGRFEAHYFTISTRATF